MKRALLIVVGWLSVALAVAGAVLPVLPCTPFVLLAAVCFARSSPQAMRRLRRSPLLGPILRDWQRQRGMRLTAKISAVVVAIAAPAITFAVQRQLSVPFFISLAGGAAAIAIVCYLPTVRPTETSENDEEPATENVRSAA
ncbi:YbaN family protein [Anatilimnocola floriformis]|uniref:YbaN family protein n=1 Tax=Anatilimnocola floriformis TaxID=2948575 RepID=UPI0020C4B6B4|nr:YbaN family protein [Anatilimnocola floriformis]